MEDVELLSPKELLSFIMVKTGEAVDVEEIEDEPRLRQAARLAALSDWSVGALKKLVASAGLSTLDCVTKGELRARAVEAALRSRAARGLPTLAELRKRRRSFRCYEVTFVGRKLGLSVGLVGNETVVATAVRRSDVPALQAGDEIVAVNDYPFAPCEDAPAFRHAVLDRLRDAPRPLTLTFVVGDSRWPPHLPSCHELSVAARRRPPSAPLPSKESAGATPRRSSAKQQQAPSAAATQSEAPSSPLSSNTPAAHGDNVDMNKAERVSETTQCAPRRASPPESNWAQFIADQQRLAGEREPESSHPQKPKPATRRPPPPPKKAPPPPSKTKVPPPPPPKEYFEAFLSDETPDASPRESPHRMRSFVAEDNDRGGAATPVARPPSNKFTHSTAL